MAYEVLLNSLNEMASDFMFLDGAEIDIPSAGKLLNQLEKLVKEADEAKAGFIREVAAGMNHVLEKLIFDAISDKSAVFPFVEKGISLMQTIVDGYTNSGAYDGDIQPFLETAAALTGLSFGTPRPADASLPSSPVAGEHPVVVKDVPVAENQQMEKAGPAEKKIQIQDESLLRDFIAEGLGIYRGNRGQYPQSGK